MRRILIPLAVSPMLPPHGSSVCDFAGDTMGTSWSARVVGAGSDIKARLQRQLDVVVGQMSHWEADSNLSRFNDAPAGSVHALPPEFAHVLRYALSVAKDSGGAYDPCAGALVDAWGFGARGRYNQAGFCAPSAHTIATIQAKRLQAAFDERGGLLQPGGVQLDLSSVAKGFAVDQLARCLDAQGLHHYLVEVGGELRGAGAKADGLPWWVELEGVPDITGVAPAAVALHGLAVATSGDYRRHFNHAGQRVSHTLDPRSGAPIRNDIASVTVLHAECMAADALSTALTVLGLDDGMRFAEQQQLAARFLVRRAGGVEEHSSSAFKAMLQ
jgi:thiamine biosynthesis lipoprotein